MPGRVARDEDGGIASRDPASLGAASSDDDASGSEGTAGIDLCVIRTGKIHA